VLLLRKIGINRLTTMSLFLLSLCLCACSGKGVETFRQTEFLMDTIVCIKYYNRSQEKAVKEAFAEIARIEGLMSAHIEQSDISRINNAAGKPVVVSPETFFVIQESLRYSQISAGAFDITVGPLISLWDIMDENLGIPTAAEIKKAVELVNYQAVELDPENSTVTLRLPGMMLDLGAVAKGYAIDQARGVLAKHKVKAALIEAGGDIYAVGIRPDGQEYRIGLRHPREPQKMMALVSANNTSIVTSGDYLRYFIRNGVRYHHIIDPATGEPASAGIISATVIGPNAMLGDILATTLFVAGTEKGLKLIESVPGFEAVVVTEDLEVEYSSGLADVLQLIN
jgi:thiamine biosynthesis lipoprotein